MNCPHCNVHIDEHPASPCLNVWVAEDVMGWHKDKLNNYWQDDDNRHMYSIYGDWGGVLGFDPSETLSAAWEVVETISPKLWFLDNGRGMIEDAGGKGYVFRIGMPSIMGHADTAPLAICRAGIKSAISVAST